MLSPLPDLLIEPAVRLALSEDLGRAGDITTAATVPAGTAITAYIRARRAGIVSGLSPARLALQLVDPTVALTLHVGEGAAIAAGDTLATLTGEARSILMAERVMLNFIGRMSGVATLARAYVDAVAHTRARIVCTRKTTPGLRALEKFAVQCGGATAHRYGLDDAILIKDNHIAACGGSPREALKRAFAHVQHLRMIEIEVDTLAQLHEVMAELPYPHAVLLDNMDTETLRQAVEFVDKRAICEASGGVTLSTVAAIAQTGVDFISVGALTHSAPNFDIGLDVS